MIKKDRLTSCFPFLILIVDGNFKTRPSGNSRRKTDLFGIDNDSVFVRRGMIGFVYDFGKRLGGHGEDLVLTLSCGEISICE